MRVNVWVWVWDMAQICPGSKTSGTSASSDEFRNNYAMLLGYFGMRAFDV
jgi:hypothetical protein